MVTNQPQRNTHEDLFSVMKQLSGSLATVMEIFTDTKNKLNDIDSRLTNVDKSIAEITQLIRYSWTKQKLQNFFDKDFEPALTSEILKLSRDKNGNVVKDAPAQWILSLRYN